MAMVRIHKETFKRSFLYTFLLGLLAHGYGFLHFQPSHDSLAEAVSNAANWKCKIQAGRFLKPLYDLALGRFTSFPWINGLMALVFLALAGYFVAEMLDLRKKGQIALVCGILTTNVTVTAISATYTQDFGADMCALALAMLAGFLWKVLSGPGCWVRKRTAALCLAAMAVCLAASMALYQAFVFSFVTMVMAVSVFRCLEYPQMSLKKIWAADFFAAGAAILGGLMYFAGLKVVTLVTGVSLHQNNYNSVSNAWTNREPVGERLVGCLEQLWKAFAEMPGYVYPAALPRIISLLLLAVTALCLGAGIVRLAKKKHPVGVIMTILVLTALLPFAMNGVRLLNTSVHVLMTYSYWLAYVFVFRLAIGLSETSRSKPSKWAERLTAGLLCGIVLMNIQTANAGYVKKATEQQATLSVMTRVVDRLESTEGYEPGITPVVFLGTPADYLKTFEPFEEIESIAGLNANASVTYLRAYAMYFQMIMRVNVNIVYDLSDFDLDEDTCGKTMPCFPAEDSIQMLNGVMIVKFGDWFPE